MSKPSRLFYDTCYYIDLFRGNISPDLILPHSPLLIVGHPIVMMELLQGVKTKAEENLIHQIIRSVSLIEVSVKNYLDAGHLLKKLNEKKKLLPQRLYETQNDILLAISAIENSSVIVTRNKKDFEKISALCKVELIYY